MTKTKIEWATDVWNPVTGCTKVSAGCKNCYAERLAKRFWGERKFSDVRIHPERLNQPYRWLKPRRVFVNSMSDLFHPEVPDEFIMRAFDVMTRNRRHTYMILTKRPARMQAWFESHQEQFWHFLPPGDVRRRYVSAPWPDPCLWLGVSVEDQQTADERIPLLLQTPAAVRFVSCEPLLGPVRLRTQDDFSDGGHGPRWLGIAGNAAKSKGLNWVICGGESGPGARPMHPDWVRSLRDQCQAAGVPFFFKQFGHWISSYDISTDEQIARMRAVQEHCIELPGELMFPLGKKLAGRLLDGREWNEFPEQDG